MQFLEILETPPEHYDSEFIMMTMKICTARVSRGFLAGISALDASAIIRLKSLDTTIVEKPPFVTGISNK